jgi:acetyl-CoA C-acetyltransferase
MPTDTGPADRTPIIVGVGQINQRVDEGAESIEPAALMANALRLAADDSGAPDIVTHADSVRAVHVLGWRYRDPARLVAERLGCPGATTHYTHVGGNVPQVVINGACRDLAEGRAEVVLVTGAETGRSKALNRKAGTKPDWTVQPDDVEPDVWTNADASLLLDTEIGRGIAMPVQIYPLFESAWRASNGWTLAEDRRRIAELMARFSEVAAANPHAWRRQAYTPEQIDSPDDGNRFIGFPYRKLVNSNENVEQGAGIILTTVGKARALGVPEDRWVFALAGTDGADAPFVSNRVSFSDSGAVRIAGRRALELAATPAETLTHVDLYSCFPVAVQIAAHELGLSTDRDLTVTGGLPFAGGPWSNYVTHSVATMVERLRATGGTGLIFANGGYLTKHAFGVYATEPPRGGYAWERPQAEIDALGTVERADTYEGAATVESCTVMHDRADAPELAIITARLDDGRRAWGKSRDPEVMTLIETEEVVGRATKIDAEGTFAL